MPKKPLTQARVQRLVANPGERSKLSVGVLEKYGYGDLARKRLLNQRLAAPVVPGSTMTGADLAHQANADTQVQYGPAQALLARQAQAAPDYYEQYAKILNAAGQSQQAQGAQSGQAIQALYGSGPQAPGSAQGTIGAAQAGTANLLGDAERNYLTNLAAAAFGQGGQERGRYLQKGADLAREAGAFNVSDRAKIKGAEANTVATQTIASGNQALGAARIGEQHRHNVVQETKPPSASDQKTAADLAFFKKHGYYPPTGAPKPPKGPKGGKPTTGPGSLPPAQETKYVDQITRASQYLNDLKVPGKDPKTGAVVYQKARNRGEVIAWLKAHGANPAVIGVADSLSANQLAGLGPEGVKWAHRLGVHVGGRWKVVNAKPKTGAQAAPH
jgi:hypothetical protein